MSKLSRCDGIDYYHTQEEVRNMIFILVTGSIMAISISLIYRLCRFFDIEMKWSSLVLCAVMAFIVNGAAISMSPFLDRAHYVYLGLLVILAAALVTFFNEKLLSREEAAIKTANATDAAPVTPVIAVADKQAPPCTWKALPTEILPPDEPLILPANKVGPDKGPAQDTTSQDQEAAAAAAARLKARQAASDAKAAQEAAEAAARQKAMEEAAQKRGALKAAAEDAARQKAVEEAARKSAAEKADRAARQTSYLAKIEAMDSLDSILDYAYEHQQQIPDAAICAYQQAIARYPEDSYTPFLVIELGNLYKDQASYHEAISTYIKALNMPIIAVNDAMKREFTKNIRYLGSVQDILSKHHALSTPFPKISREIMQEIEDEFLQRSQQSS